MAGSGSRPLTNIPYCCLPQESGPCLSASVGDRPLRSPTHRRLGGPSPRLPSNGTHARPVPPEGFDAPGMPLARRMADYPAFPPATRRDGVGCIRVTHPSATLTVPKDRLPSDLHVLGLPLAFILSQDQTLRCTIVALVFYSESRVPPRCSLCSFYKVPCPARHHAAPVLCWPQTIKELRSRNPPCQPLFPSELDCKNTTFFDTGNQKIQLFLIKYYICLLINYIKKSKTYKNVNQEQNHPFQSGRSTIILIRY